MSVGDSTTGVSRDDAGETMALLVLWPALLTAILLLVVHAFIVSNARAQAEVAASGGLRAAWRIAAVSDLHHIEDPPDSGTFIPYYDDPEYLPRTADLRHPAVAEMLDEAQDAVAYAAAGAGGWRWWHPNVAEVYSDWCARGVDANDPPRPGQNESGWIRIVVSGDVVGPLAVLFPDRLVTVYAVASGPALPAPSIEVIHGQGTESIPSEPVELPAC